jgi:hypothetical protein
MIAFSFFEIGILGSVMIREERRAPMFCWLQFRERNVEDRTACQNDASFQEVLELANVAGPLRFD